MRPAEWDVIVVGAGPAGCAAAAAVLQRKASASVLLLDRHSFPRDKACGDGIAAEALDVLTTLGFSLPAILDGFPPVTSLHLRSPGGVLAARPLSRAARVIPREVFDARLVRDVVSRGVVFAQRRVRMVEMRASAVTLDAELSAAVVIAADGAESLVRRALFPTTTPKAVSALAIRGYAAEMPHRHGVQTIVMSERHWPAYAWSFPLGNGRANVGYGEWTTAGPLTKTTLIRRMNELLPDLGAPSNLRAHRLPLSPGRPRCASGRVLLAGDALSLINPLSGEGIYYAVLSGMLAGHAAVRGAGAGAGAEYRRSLRQQLGGHLRSTDALAALIRRPLLVDAAVAVAAESQRSFDDLVLLGLADGHPTPRLLGGIARQAAAAWLSRRLPR